MSNLFELIQKFKEGIASQSEKETLLEALSLEEEELRAQLENDYEKEITSNLKIISQEKSAEIFNQIQQKKSFPLPDSQKPKPKFVRLSASWLRGALAASVIGIMAIGIWYLDNKPSDRKLHTVSASGNHQQLKQLSNTTGKTIETTLQDGSTVSLEANSAIAYYQPFKLKRDISLAGKATFKVKKDSVMPFTVYANGITTTALGTVFSVDAFNNRVQVKLLEGKVVIRSENAAVKMKDTFLNPGEQVLVVEKTGDYTVSNFEPDDKKTNFTSRSNSSIKKINSRDANTLTFNKAPLADVFNKIGNRYNIPIKYNKKDLGNLSFTGSFLPADSLQTILTIICTTNDLSFKNEKGVIVITK